jgi:serine/threonine protein phosphatase PrpC
MVGCFMKNDKVYCCNVGDSRAVMGYQENGQWQARQLSRDHKPSIQEEAERILKAGGRV